MKKGFTLIEIVLSVLIIVVIGTGATIVAVKNNDKKSETNILETKQDNFYDALNVYLSVHSDVVRKVNEEVEGVAISLELLKKDGLISDNLGIDYLNNYFIVTSSVLDDNILSDDNKEIACLEKTGLNIVASWDNDEESKKMNFCTQKTDEIKIPEYFDEVEIEMPNEQNDPYASCTSSDNRLYCKIIKNIKSGSYNTKYQETPKTDIKSAPASDERILAKTQDEFGYTYYFRGDVIDNYVTFNDMCWRVVRIQGDGSIKLILESSKSACSSSISTSDSYFVSDKIYTSIYTIRYPYISYKKNISGYLDNWLTNNSINTTNLKKQRFCLGNLKEYDSLKTSKELNGFHIYDGTPSLNCRNTNDYKTYEDYVATISLDEAYFAGVAGTSYIDKVSFYTLTQKHLYSQYFYLINPSNISEVSVYGKQLNLRPVIVLKSGITRKSGSGTISSPYKIN